MAYPGMPSSETGHTYTCDVLEFTAPNDRRTHSADVRCDCPCHLYTPDSWTVVQIMRGEPHGAVGPFASKEEAEGWIQQHRELMPLTELAAFHAVDTVRPR